MAQIKIKTKMPSNYISVEDYANELGLTVQSVRNRIRRGYIKCVSVGNTYAIDLSQPDSTPIRKPGAGRRKKLRI